MCAVNMDEPYHSQSLHQNLTNYHMTIIWIKIASVSECVCTLIFPTQPKKPPADQTELGKYLTNLCTRHDSFCDFFLIIEHTQHQQKHHKKKLSFDVKPNKFRCYLQSSHSVWEVCTHVYTKFVIREFFSCTTGASNIHNTECISTCHKKINMNDWFERHAHRPIGISVVAKAPPRRKMAAVLYVCRVRTE